MKTVTKIFSGVLLASAFAVGYAQNAHCAFDDTTSFKVTKSSYSFDNTKNVVLVNKTDGRIQKIEMKTDKDNEYKDLYYYQDLSKDIKKYDPYSFDDWDDWDNSDSYDSFNSSSLFGLAKDYQMSCSDVEFGENATKADFRIVDKDGNERTIKNVSLSRVQYKNHATFIFTQIGSYFDVDVD